MLQAKCKLEYHKFSDAGLEIRVHQVANGIYTNPLIFTTPPLSLAEYTAIQDKYITAVSEYNTYGVVKKTALSTARKKIINTLDLLATYVDSEALGDTSKIILAGFVPTSTTPQNSLPIDKINSFLGYRTDNVGEIAVDIPAVTGRGAITYFCICSEGSSIENPTLMDGQLILDNTTQKIRCDYSKSRKKLFKGLTPGTVYYFYVFACNTASVAPLSDVKSIMAA